MGFLISRFKILRSNNSLKLFSILLTVMAGLLLFNNVYATTYYVDGANGDDANSGLDWDNALATVGKGEDKATSSGDIVEISGGNYAQQIVAQYAGVTFKGSSAIGHNTDVVMIAPTNGFQITQPNITVENLKVTNGSTSTTRAFLVTADGFTANNVTIYDYSGIGFSLESGGSNFTLNNVTVMDVGAYAVKALAGSNGTIKYSLFEGYTDGTTPGSTIYITGSGTDVNIYNSTIMGAYRFCVRADTSAALTMRNSIVSSCGVGYSSSNLNYTIYTVSPATADLDYSILDGYGRFPHSYNATDASTLGSSIQSNAFLYFNNWGVDSSYFVITVDDRTHAENANDISSILDGYGFHMTYNIDTPDIIDASDWITIKDMESRGHDIGDHSSSNHHLDNTGPFEITYTGSDTNVAVAVSSNSTSFSITGDGGTDNVGPLDLTNPAYNPLQDLCTYIDGLTNYSCTLTGDSGENTGYQSNTLSDTTTNLSSTAVVIPYDLRVPSLGGRFFKEAIVDTKTEIETQIGGGYTVVSLAYPGQAHNSTVRDAVADAGYQIARGGSGYTNSDYDMSNISDIFQAPMNITTNQVKGSGYDSLTTTQKEVRVREFARAWSAFALQNGIMGALTIHDSSTFSPTEVGWLVDELDKNGVSIVSMRELITAIKADWSTSDDRAYTKSFADVSDFSLKTQSPAIDAGNTIAGITTDALGNPFYGAPDLGMYEYQPTLVMGTDEPNITGDVRIYNDGKYRYSTTTSGSTTADLTVQPNGGFSSYGTTDTRPAFIDVSIATWNTSGDYSKEWTESGTASTGTTSHIIGDLNVGDYYTVQYTHSTDPQAVLTTYQADVNGQISFNYSGGYSDVVFNVDEDTTGPNSFELSSPVNHTANSSNSPSFTWSATTDSESGMAKYQLFIDGSLDTDSISSSTTTSTPTNALSCGTHTWYVRAVDNSGNTTNSTSTYTYTRKCSSAVASSSSSSISYSIDITSPSSGDEFINGDKIDITWNADNGSFVSLYYSNDNDVTFNEIEMNISNSGSYSWNIPDGLDGEISIKIELTDLVDILASDENALLIGNNSSAEEPTVPTSGQYGKSPVTGEYEQISEVSAGMFVKGLSYNTVYYIDTDGTRRPFMNALAYFTWSDSWDDVVEVTGATLTQYSLGIPMLPQEGVVMVKIQSDNKVYAIEGDNTLRWVTSEQVAEDLYGTNWNEYIIDIEPTFFGMFQMGDDIEDASYYTAINGKTIKTRMELAG